MNIIENGIYLNLELTRESNARLLHLSCFPQKGEANRKMIHKYTLAELQVSGFNQCDHHGNKHTGCNPSQSMCYREHKDYRNEYGRKLEICQELDGIYLTTHLQFYDGISVVRSYNEVENKSEDVLPIEYLSSFALTGLTEDAIEERDKNGIIHIPHNTWFGENQWKKYTLNELGYDAVNQFSMKRISLSNTGSWACDEYLPMGSYTNTELSKTLTWQIETSGSWHWEISDVDDELYLQAAGPTYQENNFLKLLKPGERFLSVPCAVAVIQGGFEDTIQELTKYRRVIRRKNEDNEKLPVIFNDYMNCLMGNPSTGVLKPLIDSAAEVGCEYFCVDCGWYDDGSWWDGVGEWLPAQGRFPGGIEEVISYIREKGMVPGLWLEIEVMGINCPMVQKVPVDWFFQRNGRPIIDHCRYQLDFRNPEVRAYADEVFRRLVKDYGVGYIKMDYNINAGVGTDRDADSAGEGLLEHTRAYLSWMDDIFAAYPDLIIENCSSGGMRMEYSMLSRQSIQSVTDQTDYVKMSAIAANCVTSCTPEQAAIWAYPLRDGTEEEVIYNMVNAMLFRIHQSGYLGELGTKRLSYVAEGIQCYKRIRNDIKTALPIWPAGLASMSDEYQSFALDCGDKIYLAVWRTAGKGEAEYSIPFGNIFEKISHTACIYPSDRESDYSWKDEERSFCLKLKPLTARLFELSL